MFKNVDKVSPNLHISRFMKQMLFLCMSPQVIFSAGDSCHTCAAHLFYAYVVGNNVLIVFLYTFIFPWKNNKSAINVFTYCLVSLWILSDKFA